MLKECSGSIKTGPFGTKLAAREYSTDGAPVISVGEIGYGRLRVSAKTKRVPTDVVARMPEYLLEAGDVVFGRKGAVDRSAWVRDDERGFFLGSDGIRLRFGPGVDSRFMAYQLQSRRVRSWIIQHAVGTTLASLNEPTLKSVPLSMPSLVQQRAIAATLGALDEKIESNQRLMSKLDELFHVLWSHTYHSVPNGTAVPLSDRVTTQYGLTASASADVRGDKFLRVTDINKRNWISWSDVPSAPSNETSRTKYALEKGDLLVARMADPGKSAIYDGGPTAVFASYLVRLKARSYSDALYIYGFLKSRDYADYAAGATTGSVQKNMNARVIVGTTLRWPDPTTLSHFADSGEPLRAKISQLVDENDQLSSLRDSLLPELLSGSARVPNDELFSRS